MVAQAGETATAEPRGGGDAYWAVRGQEDGYADCTKEGPEYYRDLTLKFDAQVLVAALGAVEDGDCLVLQLTGSLAGAGCGGGAFVGEGVVWIKKKGR
jgi:hypothetical protein